MECPASTENELNIDCRWYNLGEMLETIKNHFPDTKFEELEITIESYCTTTDHSCSGDYQEYFSIRKI